MNDAKPINIPLIVFTLVISIVGMVIAEMTEPTYYSDGAVLIFGLGILLFSPIMILWAKALWNTVVPRITGWREIGFWEAAGLTAIIFFFMG